ncbi:MAG: DNA repair protein RecO [Verrucomicrobiota bacterium]|jgi:DNA repair protein RecO (recombination protein O)
MIETATGIILRTRPLTETSLILHWLTTDFGRLATVAKGARRQKSPFAGRLDLFYVADFSFSRSRSSELHNLREVNVRETHEAIRGDIMKLQQAAYATAIVEQATETDTPLPEIFRLTRDFLKSLCELDPLPQNIFAFELKLLRELGLEPDMAEAHLTPGAKKIVAALMDVGRGGGPRLILTEPQNQELRQWLHGFLIYNLGKIPRGRNAAVA